MIPVVFIHTGRKFEWMDLVIARARRYNENVVLIDDDNLEDYRSDVDAFHGAYSNMSTNPSWFEEHAFWRWLILNEYCQKNNIDVVFHLDSDTMIYTNVEAEYEKVWHQYPISLVLGECGATCYFTREHLAGVSELILRTYIDKNNDYLWLKDMYERMQLQGLDGGANDMVLLKLYRLRHNLPYGEMTDIRNGTTFDHTMKQPLPGGYRMLNGIKDIEFIKGLPYATIEKTGQKILMKSLHFQGDSELRMNEFENRIKESEK